MHTRAHSRIRQGWVLQAQLLLAPAVTAHGVPPFAPLVVMTKYPVVVPVPQLAVHGTVYT